MGRDLHIVACGNLPQINQSTPVELTQTGDSNTQIAYVQNFDGTNVTNVILTGQGPGNMASPSHGTLNKEYYNLVVMGGETFSAFTSGHFTMQKDRALTESVSPGIKKMVNSLHTEAIEFVKTLPTIFASENTCYGCSDDTQQAFFGIITEVRVQDNGIKIYYQTLNAISQKKLNELRRELAIDGRPAFNELDRTHWTIKRVYLVEELRKAGITVYAP